MIAISFVALAAASLLPPDRQAIARQVAGDGRPSCITYEFDGSSGPCLPEFEEIPGGLINAVQRGARISFTRAAVRHLTPDEFALMAGHEIAHFYLGHKEPDIPTDELAADRLGAELACKAGYSPSAGASLFRLLKAGTTHPPQAQRRAVVLTVPCAQVR